MSSSEENLAPEAELREQVKQLLDENAELKRTIDKQHNEIKRLKQLLDVDVDDKKKRKTRSTVNRGSAKSKSLSLPQSPVMEKRRQSKQIVKHPLTAQSTSLWVVDQGQCLTMT